MTRGDVFVAHLKPRSGSEIRGPRPVVVMSHDGFNQIEAWRSIIVVPLTTSSAQARRGPTAVPIPDGAGGLRRPGVAVCHQITTLDRSKLGQRLGALPPDVLAAVEDGVRAALGLS